MLHGFLALPQARGAAARLFTRGLPSPGPWAYFVSHKVGKSEVRGSAPYQSPTGPRPAAGWDALIRWASGGPPPRAFAPGPVDGPSPANAGDSLRPLPGNAVQTSFAAFFLLQATPSAGSRGPQRNPLRGFIKIAARGGTFAAPGFPCRPQGRSGKKGRGEIQSNLPWKYPEGTPGKAGGKTPTGPGVKALGGVLPQWTH